MKENRSGENIDSLKENMAEEMKKLMKARNFRSENRRKRRLDEPEIRRRRWSGISEEDGIGTIRRENSTVEWKKGWGKL